MESKTLSYLSFFFSLTQIVEIFTQFQTKKRSKTIDTFWSRSHPV